MAIAIDNAGQSGSTPSATTVTISSFVVGSGSNRLLLVGVSMNNHGGDGPTQVDTVTFGGAGLTLIGTVTNSDDARLEIWKLVAPVVSTADIVVTVDRNTGGCGIVAGAMSFTGVHQSTPTSAISGATGTSTLSTVDISSAADELVMDTVAVEWDATGLDIGAGQTERWGVDVSTTQDINGYGSTEPGAASVTMSWTQGGSGDHWAIGAVSIKPAAAAAGNPWYAYAQQ